MTPLGAEVDPLVNCKNARSDGSRTGKDGEGTFFLWEGILSMEIHAKFSGHAAVGF